MLEVYVDVDLIKALVNAYNPTTRSFHRKDMRILCTLSKDAIVEAFDLQGPMLVPINLGKLEAAFETERFLYNTCNVATYLEGKSKQDERRIPKNSY